MPFADDDPRMDSLQTTGRIVSWGLSSLCSSLLHSHYLGSLCFMDQVGRK